MIVNQTIVLSGHLPWCPQRQTPHYVASHLATRATVIYLEPFIAWMPTTAGYSLRLNLAALHKPLRKVAANIWVYTPWALPGGRFPAVRHWNAAHFGKHFPSAVVSVAGTPTILWLSDLVTSPLLLRLFPQTPAIFHALDPWTTECEMQAAELLARESQLVLAASPHVASRYVSLNPSTRLFPNGWDLPQPPRQVDTSVPPLSNIPRPRVGLVGNLGSNLDYSLIHHLATSLPISVVVIGKPVRSLSRADRIALKRLHHLANVHFLGERPTDSLVDYIAAFDVCIAPYKQIPRVYGSDPLKIYQYLSLGKPTVTTPVETLVNLSPLVLVAQSRDEFAAYVRALLDSPVDAELTQMRRRYAASTHWHSRWSELEPTLRSYPQFAFLASDATERLDRNETHPSTALTADGSG